ncbi:MAG: ABC transporter ATP-binding protein [Pseudomonadales bacterium]|nr:ABC transporter ATP-binding protein [Pseudomonadales bacterium]NRA15451.1 ABC transporter ATP-binding protein [Oceanospirillaceae bacterium]
MALFEATHLQKRFGEQVVLEDITLSFEEGQLSGIMGPNGAGKSTCFNVLTGQYKPDNGRVVFDGQDITGKSARVIAGMGISRSFQIMNLFDEFSAIENILIALPDSIKRSFNPLHDIQGNVSAMEKAADVLNKVGLSGREFIQASSLPYGERRALEIGVALASNPRLLFLDEPTQGLGADGTARLSELINELKKSYTIVVIEHDMDFLFGLADKISVIHWGQVIASGTPDQLRQNEWVKASTLGEIA